MGRAGSKISHSLKKCVVVIATAGVVCVSVYVLQGCVFGSGQSYEKGSGNGLVAEMGSEQSSSEIGGSRQDLDEVSDQGKGGSVSSWEDNLQGLGSSDKLPGEMDSTLGSGSGLESDGASNVDDVEMRDIFVEPAVGSTNISPPDLSRGAGLERPYKHVYSSPLQKLLLQNLAAGEYSLNATGIWGALSASDIFDEIVEGVKENPQYGYIKQCVFKKETKTIFIELRPSRISYTEMNQSVERKIAEIISEVITDDMHTRDKVLAIADYIVKNSVYDYKAAAMVDELGTGDIPEDVLPAFHAYGPLIEGKGCCMGYANALHLALNRLGILSVQDWGTLGSLGDHMWNSVYIDEVWYDFDITNYTPRLGGSALRYGVTDKVSKLKHSISSYRFEE